MSSSRSIENHQSGIRDFHLGMKSTDQFSNVDTSNLGRTLSSTNYAPPNSAAVDANNRANSPGRANFVETKAASGGGTSEAKQQRQQRGGGGGGGGSSSSSSSTGTQPHRLSLGVGPQQASGSHVVRVVPPAMENSGDVGDASSFLMSESDRPMTRIELLRMIREAPPLMVTETQKVAGAAAKRRKKNS